MANREEPLTEAEIRNRLNELHRSTQYHEGRLLALTHTIIELSNHLPKDGLKAQIDATFQSLLQKYGEPHNANILLGIQTVQESFRHSIK